jgi:hypothetical protein
MWMPGRSGWPVGSAIPNAGTKVLKERPFPASEPSLRPRSFPVLVDPGLLSIGVGYL